MKIARTIEDFIRENDAELRRFISFLARTMDADTIDDCIQSFYLAAIKGRLFENFDDTLPNPEKAYNTWVHSSARNMVNTFFRTRTRANRHIHITEVQDAPNGETTAVLDAVVMAQVGGTAGYSVDPTCSYSSLNSSVELDTLATLDAFIEDIEECCDLSDQTRNLCLSYLSMSRGGLSPSEVARANKVSPAYMSYLRSLLRAKFTAFRESWQQKNQGFFAI